MADQSDIFKKAQELHEGLKSAQDKLTEQTIVGEAGGGAVKVEMNGLKRVDRVMIDPEFQERNDTIVLEEAVKAACNDASDKAENIARSVMGEAMAGLQLPGEE